MLNTRLSPLTELMQHLIGQCRLLDYFTPFEVAGITREGKDLIEILCSSPTAALMLANVLTEDVGLDVRDNLNDAYADVFCITLTALHVRENKKALADIASRFDAYHATLQQLRRCPGLLHISLRRDIVQVHCSQALYRQLNEALELAPPHGAANSILPMFPAIRLTPEELIGHLPRIQALAASLSGPRPMRPQHRRSLTSV